jgi:hypothetical protein
MSKKQSSCSLVINLLVGWVVVCLLVASAAAWVQFSHDYAEYQMQNTCIAHWIAQGVERRDIQRMGETCYPNGTVITSLAFVSN